MLTSFDYPFEALLGIQRALEARRASDWLGAATTGAGTFPPINVFQKGDDFIAIIELSGIDKQDINIVAKQGEHDPHLGPQDYRL
jgi:HSP20 family protein